MDNSSSNPPTTIFGNLSLADRESPPQHDNNSISEGLSPRTTDLSFAPSDSVSESSSSSGGVFLFGQQSPKQSASSRSIFQIGSSDQHAVSANSGTHGNSFTFEGLHNMTPPHTSFASPSPFSHRKILPLPRPKTSQLQSPSRNITTPAIQNIRSVSASNIQTHLSPSLSPPSSPSGSRHGSLSFTSPTPLTPSTLRIETPGSDHVPSTTPKPPAPVAPYDPRNEPAPTHPLFTSAFQDALKQGPEIAKMTVKAIKKMQIGSPGELDSEVSRFLKDAKDLQEFQGTDTRTIAVLGDSGEGIAETGDIGSACTSVVTEYRQRKTNHTEPITIDVEYLSVTEIRELIQELLWSYRQLFLPIVESNETSEQEYNRYMRESEQAWSALNAAFKHKRQFTPKFAQDTSDGALERITHQLVEWTREIEWPAGGVDGFWTSTAQTAEECVHQTKLFMQDRLWPFTKVIRVYINSQVLKTGIILADLPGLQDTNLARVRATQDYLIKCDNIMIVAKISRAITDQSVKSSLFYVLSRHVPTEWEQSGAQKLKVAVVCTKSEEINLGAARREFCGPDKAISTETMAGLDTELDMAKSSGDRIKKKAIKKQQELLLVQARNEHVKTNLQSLYTSEMNGRSLDVFCVSNKWYEKYCPKGNTDLARASGIPALRRFCHSLSADAQLNETKHFLRSRLSALLNTLDLWAGSLLDKQDVIEQLDDSVQVKVKELIDQVPTLIETFRQDFSKCFQEQIMSFFSRRDTHWDQAASKEGLAWKTWHWSKSAPELAEPSRPCTNITVAGQYNAWCLNNGDHETPKRGRENWNAKIIWKMRMELEGQWDLVEEEVADVFSSLLDGATSFMNRLKSSICHSLPSQPVNPIVNSIAVQIESLKYEMSREEKDFLAQVRVIRRYTSESNSNSYILKDMIPLYRCAAGQKKDGKAQRQISIIQGHIEEGIIFPKLSIAVAESMNDLVTTTSNRLESMLSDAFDIVKTDLDIIFQSCQRPQVGLAACGGERENRMKEFAEEIKNLKQRHERLLRDVEAI